MNTSLPKSSLPMGSGTKERSIFEECKRYTLDQYWIEIFDNCVRGRFPKGIKYYNNIITVYIDKKPECISLRREMIKSRLPQSPKSNFVGSSSEGEEMNADLSAYKDAKEVCVIMIEIFKKLGMKSSSEISQQKLEILKIKDKLMNQSLTERDTDNWKLIKPKQMRNNLLLQYALTLGKKYNLNSKQIQQLLQMIKLGITFHSILPKDIDYKSGKINFINGIDIEENILNGIKSVNFIIKNPKITNHNSLKGSLDKGSVDKDRIVKKLKCYIKTYVQNSKNLVI